MKKLSPFVMMLILPFGCGDNLQTVAPVASFGPPTALKTFSVNQSSVGIQWAAAPGSSDSTFRGYIVEVGPRRDTLLTGTLSFVATSLPAGESVFLISSLRKDGSHSDAATVRWAPAARFDSAYAVFENNTPVSTRPEGFNVGTSTTNPSTMVLDPTDPQVQQTMDFYVNGGTQQVQQPLAMWSANLYIGSYNRTLFSTQTNSSLSLDYALTEFPSDITFTKDSIAILDNTIYYAKIIGDPQQINFARIHVHIRAGTSFPNRIVEIRVSLQRVPGLLYAFDQHDAFENFRRSSKTHSFFFHNHS